MIRIFYVIIWIIGAGLTACSFGLHKRVYSSNQVVKLEQRNTNAVDSMILPYKSALESEMSRVIASADVAFINERNNGNLGFLVTDVLRKEIDSTALCLMNFGGLRSTINKGDVTVGDVFKLLPFDNYAVLVKMDSVHLIAMVNWIEKTGGQPISGFYLKNQVLLDLRTKLPLDLSKEYWLITNDYLANGGDNAQFFVGLEKKETNLLLRDAFMKGIEGKRLMQLEEQRIIH